MNWTGGRLQRHSRNAAKGSLGRQKAHFAKARTQLQNGPGENTHPFRPDYLDKDGDLHGRELASCGRGNASRPQTVYRREEPREARHLRREKQLSGQLVPARRLTDATRGPSGESAASASLLTVPRPTLQNQALGCDTSRPPQNRARENYNYRIAVTGNRMPVNPNTADEAWEDSKRRLLERPDWAGLAPSRPVKMHFPLRKDKDRIGKRRKIDKHTVAQSARNNNIIRQPFPLPDTTCPSPFLRRVVGNNDGEDIRVRIGTEALTNHTVDQIIQPAQGAHESFLGSSDSMLFDPPAELLRQTPSTSVNHIHARAPAIVPELHQNTGIPKSRPSTAKWQATDSKQSYRLLDADLSPTVSSAHDTVPHYRDRGSSAGEHNEATAALLKEPINLHGCSFHITQRLGEPRPPYRFVSEEPSDCSTKGVHDALQGFGMRGFHENNTTSSALVPWEDELRGYRRVPKTRGLPGESQAIDDDAPWREFLTIDGDDGSSHSTTGSWRGPGLSGQQQLDIAEPDIPFNTRAISEWDTLDAAQARKISARRHEPCDGPRSHGTSWPCQLPHDRNLGPISRNQSENKDVDHEELWKRFVFGDSSPAFEAAAHNYRGQGRPSTPEQDRSRLWSASCLAVGGVSSANSTLLLPTSSKLASPHFSCVSDDVQDARSQIKTAPPFNTKPRAARTHNNSISPWTSSSVLGNASRLDSSGVGNTSGITANEQHVGGHAEHSVTHASLENNAFPTSGVFSNSSSAADPNLFHRGLDRNDDGGEKHSWPILLKRHDSPPLLASSVKGIPDSDEMALVDPDRIN